MKRLIFSIVLLLFCQYSYSQTIADTASFTIPAKASTYTIGDIVRDSTATGRKFQPILLYSNVGSSPVTGYITQAYLEVDTANITAANFTLLIFSDSTGFGTALTQDDNAFQTKYTMMQKYIGEVKFALNCYGTGAGGATSAYAMQSNLNIKYYLTPNTSGKVIVWCLLVADGAFQAKKTTGATTRFKIGLKKFHLPQSN